MSFWDRLQAAQAHVVARIRASIFVVAISGLAWPHQISEYLAWPGLEQPLKVTAVICCGLSLLMRAGEKNDKPEDPKP